MLDELTRRLKQVYLDGQNYNVTAANIINALEDGNIEAAAIEFVRDSDKIPTYRTWGRRFKGLILYHRETLGI